MSIKGICPKCGTIQVEAVNLRRRVEIQGRLIKAYREQVKWVSYTWQWRKEHEKFESLESELTALEKEGDNGR